LKNSRKKGKDKGTGEEVGKGERKKERETVESGRHNPTVSENGEKWLGVGLVGSGVRLFLACATFFSRKMG